MQNLTWHSPDTNRIEWLREGNEAVAILQTRDDAISFKDYLEANNIARRTSNSYVTAPEPSARNPNPMTRIPLDLVQEQALRETVAGARMARAASIPHP